MLLLQFSTSHYCRKARLALGYKGIAYRVENLTPGLHRLRVMPLTGLDTLPVLLPELPPDQVDQLNNLPNDSPNSLRPPAADRPFALGDSTAIFHFLDRYQPEPPLFLTEPALNAQVLLLEDWLDESLGTATRFVYYDYRAKDGKAIDPSWMSQTIIQLVRSQYGMTADRVRLAAERLDKGLDILHRRWEGRFLVGDRYTAADLTAAALLSPLARLPHYTHTYPWLFERIRQVHHACHEALPPGLAPV